jgi:hypothetical protein
VAAGGKESCFSFPGALKPVLTYGKGRTRRFPTNNQGGGGARVLPEPQRGQSEV